MIPNVTPLHVTLRTHIHVTSASDHVDEFDVMHVPVLERLVDLLVLLHTLLEVIDSLGESRD